jgi:hypothetical protein
MRREAQYEKNEKKEAHEEIREERREEKHAAATPKQADAATTAPRTTH